MRRRATRTVVGVLLLGCAAAFGAETGRELAADRYKRAQTLLEDLKAVPQVELGQRQYLLVVDALKSVHRASPSSSYCDDALLGVGDVYAAMIDRFGPDPWRSKAIEAYKYAIREYPHSKLLPRAKEALGDLEAGRVTTIGKARELPDAEEDEEEQPAKPAPATPKSVPASVPMPARSAPADAIVRTVSTAAAMTSPVNRVGPTPDSMRDGPATITAIRHYTHPGFTRIVIDADDYTKYNFDFLSRPRRMYFDLMSARMNGKMRLGVTIDVKDAQVARIRAAQNRVNKARVVLDLNDDVFYDIQWIANPPRLVIDLRGQSGGKTQLSKAKQSAPPPGTEKPRPEPVPAETAVARVEPEKPQSFEEAFRALTAGRHLEQPAARALENVDEPRPAPRSQGAEIQASALPRVASEPLPPPTARQLSKNLPPPKPAQATSRGSQSLIRALGLKIGRVVIDAGHGGHDTGMIGPTGLREKDVVLDVALRLGKLIETRLGAEVMYTRDDDSFLDLRDRPKVANNVKADLFLSVHANAYRSASVRGVETFYLNFTDDPWALKVASRENAASEHSVHELQDLLGKIALKETLGESREFATRMQKAVYGGLSKETPGLKNRGVRQAPMIVLIGAKMPAILTEIGFLSNPTDEKLFKSGKYRDTVAEQLYRGIESYVKSLSSHKLTMTDPETASASLD